MISGFIKTATLVKLNAPIILLLCILANAGCSNLFYYGQAIAGQTAIMVKSRDIDHLVADTKTSGELIAQLGRIVAIRNFAVNQLGLDDGGAYRRYVDLGREHVVWNVFAAGEFSLSPVTWCFPIAGCVGYRGYFSKDAAYRFADRIDSRGHDVFTSGVDAYSTLGWLPDPVLSSFVNYSPTELAALIFHELAHQVVYVKDDMVFNESFATAVEEVGVMRWLKSQGDSTTVGHHLKPLGIQRYQRNRRYIDQLTAMMLSYRSRLAEVYGESGDGDELSDEERDSLSQRKQAILDELYAQYLVLSADYDVQPGSERFQRSDFNNALLSSFDNYYRYVPAFKHMLESNNGDLTAFYEAVRQLAKQPRDARRLNLDLIVVAVAGDTS
ncbi:MAG: aminopeptidase [marine bacterium B5-7]|nr:MAG: aminopeptidase [marine bacterium B5-7]